MTLKLEELSHEAGVSIATVSRALSGKPGVSDKRRKDIQALAKQLGYRPDASAQALRTRTRSGWMLLTSSSPTQIVQHRNQALLKTIRKMAVSTQVMTTTPEESLEVTLDRIWDRPPANLLVHGIHRNIIKALEKMEPDPATSVVIMDGESAKFDSVRLDRSEGTRLATRLMLTSGVTRPVFFTPQRSPDSSDDRNRGILKAYQELGLTPKEAHFHTFSGPSAQTGYHRTLELLEERFVDAIFTYSDQMAYGVLRALYEKGIRVPEEIKVVGFDDLPHSAMTTPNLTTIGQPVQDMVEEAIRLAEARHTHPESDIQCVTLPTRLIPRESCPLLDQTHRQNTFN